MPHLGQREWEKLVAEKGSSMRKTANRKKNQTPSANRENQFVKTLLKDGRLEFLMLKYLEKD